MAAAACFVSAIAAMSVRASMAQFALEARAQAPALLQWVANLVPSATWSAMGAGAALIMVALGVHNLIGLFYRYEFHHQDNN
eukprot:6221187-Pyramimonas_sp.AAC.1